MQVLDVQIAAQTGMTGKCFWFSEHQTVFPIKIFHFISQSTNITVRRHAGHSQTETTFYVICKQVSLSFALCSKLSLWRLVISSFSHCSVWKSGRGVKFKSFTQLLGEILVILSVCQPTRALLRIAWRRVEAPTVFRCKLDVTVRKRTNLEWHFAYKKSKMENAIRYQQGWKNHWRENGMLEGTRNIWTWEKMI